MSETASAPLGIFGGTFDPVHRAHLRLVQDARSELGLAGVVWIPAGNPPHREPPRASAEHRLAMVALAIRGEPRYALDAAEARSSEPSYTVTTLLRLRAVHGDRPLVLLLGADAFLGVAGWHRWRELFELTHVAVATRPGYVLDPRQMNEELRASYQQRQTTDPASLKTRPAGGIVSFAITPLDSSASAIRARFAAGETPRDLLPTAVLDYIAANHLYSVRAPH